MLTLYLLALAPKRKQYRMALLFTDKNGDFGAISVTERGCTAPIIKVDRHMSDRSLPLFVAMWKRIGLFQRPLPFTVFNLSWGHEIENNADFGEKRPNWSVAEVNEWEWGLDPTEAEVNFQKWGLEISAPYQILSANRSGTMF